MTLAVVGSINCDVIAYVERLPRPGETFLVASAHISGLAGWQRRQPGSGSSAPWQRCQPDRQGGGRRFWPDGTRCAAANTKCRHVRYCDANDPKQTLINL